jgi:hypothetical protein
MANFDARHEAAEVVGQWDGVVLEDGLALDLARGNPGNALEMLMDHWPDTEYSESELEEIADQIARLA